jgi:hypothetical protein
MPVREFANQKSLIDHAERNGLVYLWERMRAFARRQRMLSPMPAFTKRQQLLSTDQYEIVDVRTPRGVRRAMLFPKAILQAEFAANREVLASKRSACGRSGWPSSRPPTLGMNDPQDTSLSAVYAERQEGWDVPKRVHEPEGATGPR